MQNSTTIRSCRQLWELAGIQVIKYGNELDTEDLVDTHVKNQLNAIHLMTNIRTLDLDDIIIKLQTWKEECYLDDSNLHEAEPETLLVLSALRDLQALQVSNLSDTENKDTSMRA